MANLELPSNEFEILKQDDEVIHLYDKKTDKIYVYDKVKKSWRFPAGSRIEFINYLFNFNW